MSLAIWHAVVLASSLGNTKECWSAKEESRWEVGAPGASCDEVCAAKELLCTESMWPATETTYPECSASFRGNFFEAPVLIYDSVAKANKSGPALCAWQGPDRVWSAGKYATSSRCPRKAHMASRRICPCRGVTSDRTDLPLLRGGILGWKNFSSGRDVVNDSTKLWWGVNGPVQNLISGVERVQTVSTVLYDLYYTRVSGRNTWSLTQTLDQPDECYTANVLQYAEVPVPEHEEVAYLAATDIDTIAITTTNKIYKWTSGRLSCLPYTEDMHGDEEDGFSGGNGAPSGKIIVIGPSHRTGAAQVSRESWNPEGEPWNITQDKWNEGFQELTEYPDSVVPSAKNGEAFVDPLSKTEKFIHSITTTHSAMCVLFKDGSIEAFGAKAHGGVTPDGVSDVVQVFASRGAFTAIMGNGSMVTWGDTALGGDHSLRSHDNKEPAFLEEFKIVTVVANEAAFAALYIPKTQSILDTAFSLFSVYVWGSHDHGGSFANLYDISESADKGSCKTDLWRNKEGIVVASHVTDVVGCELAWRQLNYSGFSYLPGVQHNVSRPSGCLVEKDTHTILFNENKAPEGDAQCYWDTTETDAVLSDNWYRELFLETLEECRNACCEDEHCGAGTLVQEWLGHDSATCRLYRHDLFSFSAPPTPEPPTETPFVFPDPDENTTSSSDDGFFTNGTFNGSDDNSTDTNETQTPTTFAPTPAPTEEPLNITSTSFYKIIGVGRVCHGDSGLWDALKRVSAVYASRRGFLALTDTTVIKWPVRQDKNPPKNAVITSVHVTDEAFVVIGRNATTTTISTIFSVGGASGFFSDKVEPVADIVTDATIQSIKFTTGSAAVLWNGGKVDAWQTKPLALERFYSWQGKACFWKMDVFYDGNWKFYSKRSAAECAERCLDTPGCTGFEYPMHGGYCAPWMHGSCSRTWQPLVGQYYIREFKTQRPQDLDLYILKDLNMFLSAEDFVQDDMVLLGKGRCLSVGSYLTSPINQFLGTTVQQCQKLCLQNDDCLSIQYEDDGGICSQFDAPVDNTFAFVNVYCYKVREKLRNGIDVATVQDNYAQYLSISFRLNYNDTNTVVVNNTLPHRLQNGSRPYDMLVWFNQSQELFDMVIKAASTDAKDLQATYQASESQMYLPKVYTLQLVDEQGELIGHRVSATTRSCDYQYSEFAEPHLLYPLIQINTLLSEPGMSPMSMKSYGFLFSVLSRCGNIHSDHDRKVQTGWFQSTQDWTCPLNHQERDKDYIVMDQADITTKEQCSVACTNIISSSEHCTSFIYPHREVNDACVLFVGEKNCLTNLSLENPKGMVRAENSNWWVHQYPGFTYDTRTDNAIDVLEVLAWQPNVRETYDRASAMAKSYKDFGDYGLRTSLEPYANTSDYSIKELVSSNTFFGAMIESTEPIHGTENVNLCADSSSQLLVNRFLVVPNLVPNTTSIEDYKVPLTRQNLGLDVAFSSYAYFVGDLKFSDSGIDSVVLGISSLAALRFGLDHDECEVDSCRAGTEEPGVVCLDADQASWSVGDFVCACRYVTGESIASEVVCGEEFDGFWMRLGANICLGFIIAFGVMHCIHAKYYKDVRHRELMKGMTQLYNKHASEVETEAMHHMLKMNEGNELPLLRVLIPHFSERMHEARVFLLHQRRIEYLPEWRGLPQDLVRRIHDFIFGLETIQRMQRKPVCFPLCPSPPHSTFHR